MPRSNAGVEHGEDERLLPISIPACVRQEAAPPDHHHHCSDTHSKAPGAPPHPPPGSRQLAGARVKVTLLLVLLLLSTAASQLLTPAQLSAALNAAQHNPATAALVFVALFALGIVLLLPGMVLSICAGAAFGFGPGAGLAWAATTLGQTAAFLVGRYLLRDMVAGALLTRVPQFDALDAAVSREGWKLVLLLRVSPVLPWNVLNYALSATGIGLRSFALPSAAIAAPYATFFAYLGSTGSRMAALLSDGGGRRGPHAAATAAAAAPWVLVTGVMLVASGAGLALLLRRVLRSVSAPDAATAGADAGDVELAPNAGLTLHEQQQPLPWQEAGARGGAGAAGVGRTSRWSSTSEPDPGPR